MTEGRLTDALETTLAVFDGTRAPLTTTEVAEDLDLGRRSTYDRLDRLADDGFLETKKVGANARVWWRATPATDDRTDADPASDDPDATADADDAAAATGAGVRDGGRELERYRTVFETAGDAIYVLDESLRFSMVNRAAVDLTGRSRKDLIGTDVADVIGVDAVERAIELDETLADGERDVASVEFTLTTADGREVPVETRFTRLRTEGGIERVGVARDVTERVERERELERYRTVFETVDDGVYTVDTDGRFTMANDAYAELTGYDRDDLLGAHVSKVVDEETIERAGTFEQELLDGERDAVMYEAEVVTADGERVPAEATFAILPGDDDEFERVGVVRDVSERVERERELRNRIRQQEVVTDLGQRALEDRDLDALMAEASELVAETLDNAYCKVLDLDEEAEELHLRQGVGWDDGVVGAASVSAVEDDSQAAYTLATEEPVVVEDLTTETRFSGPELLTDHDVRSGISTTIGSPTDPWGILGTHDTARKQFSEHDANFVRAVTNILSTAINRHDRERELERQRERLTVLDDLNAVFREVTEAVIDQSTRDEIEVTVCERLAASESYEFAWIGDVDVQSRAVSVRTRAGTDGYLDDVTVTADPDDELGRGATGRAVRTGEVQVAQSLHEDPEYEPWREAVREHGVRSSAAIPIVADDTLYGVLNVYSERPNAFDDDERAVMSQLGEVVGHAIAAVERKRALTSDEVVELEFEVADVFDAVDLPVSTEGTITLDSVLPAGDDVFVEYCTATDDAMPAIEAMVESDEVPHWESMTVLDDRDGETRFELRLTESPVLSTVATYGGSVREARIQDGDLYLRIHLDTNTDVRRFVDALREETPSLELVTQRQVSRDDDRSTRRTAPSIQDLTDRQRSALEAAYRRGYFAWPRDATGEAVAESLGVTPSTFHQHVRRAQQQLLTTLFDDDPPQAT